jgi:DNA invertase Pin-like site-specific DNA recombinase
LFSQQLQTSESFSFPCPKVKRAAAYIRVSTSSRSRRGDEVSFDQNPEVQEEPLRALITQRGWSTHRVYSDRASGAKESRPGLDELMADARRAGCSMLFSLGGLTVLPVA